MLRERFEKIVVDWAGNSKRGMVDDILSAVRESLPEKRSEAYVTEARYHSKGWNACREEMIKTLEGK